MSRDDTLTEHYEELRQSALGQQPSGTIWGLVVLKAKGMASWVRSWQKYGGGGIRPIPVKESAPISSPVSSVDDEVVRVLADMIWALQKEA